MNAFAILGFIYEPNFHKVSLSKQFPYSSQLITAKSHSIPFDDDLRLSLPSILGGLLSIFLSQFPLAI